MHSEISKIIKIFIILGVIYCTSASMEDPSNTLSIPNEYYGRQLDFDLLTRLLTMPPRLCHSKRNSELINSLLGLPKNMNNAGK
ncbi:pigment-dispersing hormone peptides [Trichogramma pretiosum]|uniref:Uncharacterized protein n=1 Tax=Trichogramma kaykai TaxID=54128 RepID=A0ABD2W376_9HYME|nr:pigment-dispersing hormone peptides [Trichogramma pretiosum]